MINMKNVASWLLVFFMGMFWMFRIAVTLSAQFGGDFGGFIVINNTFEIALLFLTLLCFILIMKRNISTDYIYYYIPRTNNNLTTINSPITSQDTLPLKSNKKQTAARSGCCFSVRIFVQLAILSAKISFDIFRANAKTITANPKKTKRSY